jgi:hypothetical protein
LWYLEDRKEGIMDPENAENVEPQSDEQYFKGINKGFMIVVALICLVLKLFGLIK